MKLDTYDKIIVISVALKVLTIFFTHYVVFLTAELTQTTIQQTSAVLETNVLLKLIYDVQGMGAVGIALIMPASLLAFYHLVKPYLLKEPRILQFLVWIIFYSFLFDAMTDFGALVGLIQKWGLI
jgi:Sec-independent protein secretion pathway component TatC